MQNSGLRPDQVVQVRGYADQDLRKPLQPQDASNRRVTLIVQYVNSEQQPMITSNGSLPPAKQLNSAPTPPAKIPMGTAKEAQPEK